MIVTPQNMPTYSDDFLAALSDWQKGWSEDQEVRRKKGQALIDTATAVPASHRKAVVCFRKRTLLKTEIVDVIGRDCLDEKGATSWTLTPATVMDPGFKGNYRVGTFGEAIFMHQPKPSDVILNLASLYDDSEFRANVSDFTERFPDYSEPFKFIGNKQHEVILTAPLRGTQIVALSGIASDFDEVLQSWGITDSSARDRLFKECINRSFYPQEAFYMSPEGSQHAVCNIRTILLKAAKAKSVV